MRIQLLLILIILTPFSIAGAQEKPQEAVPSPSPSTEATPSLDDTLSWLKEKLESSLSSSRVVGRGSIMSDAFETKSFSSCDVSWRLASSATTTIPGYGIEPEGKRVSGNLGSIDPSRTEVSGTKALTFLFLFMRKDASGFLEETFETKYGREATVSSARTGLLILQFRQADETLVRRIGKAFEHAAGLCAAQKKKEPF